VAVAFSFEVKATGAVATGHGAELVEQAMPRIEEAVAQDLATLIRADLRVVLQHPSGRFQSAAPAIQQTGDTMTVDDGGVIYGPWLEGTGSRNARSRFKGYSTFRRMAQKAQERASEAAAPAVNDLIARLNG
jgi:hypothetical protein